MTLTEEHLDALPDGDSDAAADRADREAIVRIVTLSPWYIDRQQWHRLPELYTDRVTVDYTSVNGGEPEIYTGTELAAGLHAAMGGLDATQHLSSNHLVRVDGGRATCTANVIGIHKLANRFGGPMRVIGGYYRFELTRTNEGWRINTLAFELSWADGNPAIMAGR